jgi:hypothetical protein
VPTLYPADVLVYNTPVKKNMEFDVVQPLHAKTMMLYMYYHSFPVFMKGSLSIIIDLTYSLILSINQHDRQ